MAAPALDVLNDEFMNDARARMVDGQIRPNRVSDPDLLAALRRLPRERFLPASLRARAYADENVAIAAGRVLLQPMVLARLVQAVEPKRGEKALVVGAGTGYSAALLSALGCQVIALEDDAALATLARQALAEVAPLVRLVIGPLSAGWPADAPYDVVLIDGAVPAIPSTVAGQLNQDTGRMVTILRPNGNTGTHCGCAVHVEPTPSGVSVRALFDCVGPVLPAFVTPPTFAF